MDTRWNSGTVTTVAGGRGNGAAWTQMSSSYGLFIDSTFNIYISEYSNCRVTRWANGNTTAGGLVAGGNGCGSALNQLYNPWGIYLNGNKTLFVADYSNHRIQKWVYGATTGVVVAGESSVAGSFSYQLNSPTSITFDQYSNMYVLDTNNNRIQRWAPGATYGITVVSASMSTPLGLKFDFSGNLYVADYNNHRIASFKIYCPQPTNRVCGTSYWNGTLTTIAGTLSSSGTSATLLSSPYSVFLDGLNRTYVVDTGNNRIQRFSSGSTIGTTVAGWYTSPGSTIGQFSTPTAVYVDVNGSIYVVDSGNYRVMLFIYENDYTMGAQVQKWYLNEPFGRTIIGGQGNGITLNKISTTYAFYVDSQTNIYVSEYGNNRVTFWIAGNTTAGKLVAGGNGGGTAANQVYSPWGIYVNVNDTLFIVEYSAHRVSKWLKNATIGTLVAGQSGVSGPWAYLFTNPTALAFDQYGYMYVMDTGNKRIQRWWPGASYGTTVASSTTMNRPYGLSISTTGNLVVADTSNHRVISFAAVCPAPPNQVCATAIWNSTFSLAAGTGTAGSTATLLYNSYDVFIDGWQSIYVVDNYNNRVQKYLAGSNIGTTVAGLSFTFGVTPTAGSAPPQLNSPTGIFVDLTGIIYVADYNNYRIQKWLPGYPFGSTVAGGRGLGTTLDKLGGVQAIYVDAQSNIYVSDYTNHRVSLWAAGNTTAGKVVAGTSNGVAGSGINQLNGPWGIFVTSNGTLYIVDQNNHRVQRWLRNATSGSTVAGQSGVAGAFSYQLRSPTSITVDQYGYMYVLDSGNKRIQRWWPGSTYAASTTTTALPATQPPNQVCATAQWNATFTIIGGTTGTFGNTTSRLRLPYDVFVDGYGNTYVADYSNNRIQRFSTGSVNATTVAGDPTSGSGYSQLYLPTAVFLNANRTLYILDSGNYRVQKWLYGEPLGFTVAAGYGSGSTSNKISTSYGLFVDRQSNIYIADTANHRVVFWQAGNTTSGRVVAGGNGASIGANQLYNPRGIFVDSMSALYIADYSNHRVQKWLSGASTGITVAGDSSGASGQMVYQLTNPTAVSVDQYSNIYVLDSGNRRIQKWEPGSTFGITVVYEPSLISPLGMRFGSTGNLVVADTSQQRVVSFGVYCREYSSSSPPVTTTTPKPLTQIPNQICSSPSWSSTFTTVAGTGIIGTSANTLYNPFSIYIDGLDTIYIADYNNNRVQKFVSGSNVGIQVAGFGTTAGSTGVYLNKPTAVSVNSNNVIYILDSLNYRVQQ
ncbi:unnamed protein product [Rotaria socialis]|uniref:NHL repeat containing protein n=1 Tax=Rotaria socialis TaxID=392032 RepID=A0A817LZ87_9BILA|nr:unnamed protein product [Rotaria socialis]